MNKKRTQVPDGPKVKLVKLDKGGTDSQNSQLNHSIFNISQMEMKYFYENSNESFLVISKPYVGIAIVPKSATPQMM